MRAMASSKEAVPSDMVAQNLCSSLKYSFQPADRGLRAMHSGMPRTAVGRRPRIHKRSGSREVAVGLVRWHLDEWMGGVEQVSAGAVDRSRTANSGSASFQQATLPMHCAKASISGAGTSTSNCCRDSGNHIWTETASFDDAIARMVPRYSAYTSLLETMFIRQRGADPPFFRG